MEHTEKTQDTEDIPVVEIPVEKPINEQLKDKTDSLNFAQVFIKGLENMIDDLLPGWRDVKDEDLPKYIQAYHEKYKRMEERSEIAHKRSDETRAALVTQTQEWARVRATMTRSHAEEIQKKEAENGEWIDNHNGMVKQCEDNTKRIAYLREKLESNNIEYGGE